MTKNYPECKGKKKLKTSDERSKRVPIQIHKRKKNAHLDTLQEKLVTSQIKINTKR